MRSYFCFGTDGHRVSRDFGSPVDGGRLGQLDRALLPPTPGTDRQPQVGNEICAANVIPIFHYGAVFNETVFSHNEFSWISDGS